MRAPEPTDEEIADFLEGRLDAGRRAEVERWLARHPERGGEITRQRELDQALKGLGAEILDEPVPERLRRVLEQGRPDPTPKEAPPPHRLPKSRFAAVRRALGVVVLLAVGAAGGWLARATLEPATGPLDLLLADASYAYTFYSRDREHGIEFPPDGLDRFSEVSRQLFERNVDPPDLEPAGYQFRGARIAPTGRQTSTFFFFEGPEDEHIVVLFWRKGEDFPTTPGFRLLGDVAASFWFLDDLGFAILAKGGDEGSLRELSDEIIEFYDDATSGS